MRLLRSFLLLLLSTHLLYAESLPLRGIYNFTYFGFDVYQAKLYMHDDCKNLECDFTLELLYQMDFDGQDIVKRSIEEINQQHQLSDQQKKRYHKILNNIFPDVTEGDAIQGKMKDGYAQFYINNKPLGVINSKKLSKYFFDIWLSKKTSEPEMRTVLLGTD